MTSIILASASPRRLAFVRDLGLHCQVDPADLDEELWVGVDGAQTALLRARAKADLVAKRHVGFWVLAGDTVVEDAEGVRVPSPADSRMAEECLKRLLGTTHQVHSAAVLRCNEETHETIESAAVTLKSASEEVIAAYVASGEPIGKAGGLCVQGAGAQFVESIEGDVDVVVGLPSTWVAQRLAALQ